MRAASAQTPRHRSPLRLARRIVFVVLLWPLAGCSLLYEHSARGDAFVVHTDRSAEFLETTRDRIARIYETFSELLKVPTSRLGTTTILLTGDDTEVRDHLSRPDLLGYYVPLFNWIEIETQTELTRSEEGLHQVLCHEISHHFLAVSFDDVVSECWLNEGLAGNLEMTLTDEDGAEFPLLNPILLQLTRRHLFERPRQVFLPDLVHNDWSEFHDATTQERNYALSWSLVYFILEEVLDRRLPLGERIRQLVALDRDQLLRLESPWRHYFEQFSLVDTLARLARSDATDSRLTAEWALEQLGKVRSIDGGDALETLVDLSSSRPALREPAWLSFLTILGRNPNAYFLAPRAAHRGLTSIRSAVDCDSDLPPSERARMLDKLFAHHGAQEYWGPVLVRLLDATAPRLRTAAASALARIAAKPTITNPDFWQSAPPDARRREVEEWQDWFDRRGIVLQRP